VPATSDMPDRNAPAVDLTRVAVVGTSGSGKSTLAARLAGSLGHPHIELDEIHWGPDWTTDPPDVFRTKVESALAAPEWICAGNYGGVRDLVWSRATTLVWIDLPFGLTFGRACWRTLRRTVTREPVCGENRERWLGFLDPEWIPYWVIRTWRQNRRKLREAIASGEYAPLDVVVLRSRAEVARFGESQSSSARAASTSARSARSDAAST